MKKYMKPVMEGQMFVSNEFVSACGDSGVVYYFKCDAGSKWRSYHVYLNGADGIAHTADDIDWSGRSGSVRTYNPCGSTHEAEDNNDFFNGYMYECDGRCQNDRNPSKHGAETAVIVWTENGTNTHCTTNLDMSTWETAKS